MVRSNRKNPNRIRRSKEDIVVDTFCVVFITLLSLCCLYPMLHVLFASISDPVKVLFHSGPMLWPEGFSLAGYKATLARRDIWLGYANTIFYVTVGTGLNMVMTVIGAYALSRRDFMLKRALSLFIVFSMYFTASIIPNYLLMKGLHLLNTRWVLILPGAIGTHNLLVMRTALSRVPRELEEAAILDGASDMQILFHILIPLTKATMAVILLFYAVGHWNAWFNAMAFLPLAKDLYPLQLVLRQIVITNSQDQSTGDVADFLGESVKYAAIIVSTLPILCIYPFLQKYFVKGVMLGSVKG